MMAQRSEAGEEREYTSESNLLDRYSDEDTSTPLLLHTLTFNDRVKTPHSLSPEKALIHLMKGMMGTGLLSLPLAFKHAGLWTGFVLLIFICTISIYCMRQVVLAANYICTRTGRESVDYANAMRSAVECGPPWLSPYGYTAKQAVNVTMFINQLGICCVYFVFMADNLRQILPIENSMDQPKYFISHNGVLNTACLLTMILFQGVGFYGYLKFGDKILDTVTLNLPTSWFYQVLKLMFVFCVMISYPIQFYAPIERIEKWISRKVHIDKQFYYVYGSRFGLVLFTCALAELIPHLALFISLVGAFGSTALALVFPPILDILVSYAKRELTFWVWLKNSFLLMFALVGFFTGTYASIAEIVKAFGQADPVDPI